MRKNILLLLVSGFFLFSFAAYADTTESLPLNSFGIPTSNPYVVERIYDGDQTIDAVIVPGPPEPPAGYERRPVYISDGSTRAAGDVVLQYVPAMTWVFGCSATSAAMMFGYYDNEGFANMYAGPVNGGVFPMTNAAWGTAYINGEANALCPLSATMIGLDGRGARGHVDDYWVRYGSNNPDPFIGSWPEHAHGECTGDFMGTNQSEYQNRDGSTTFFHYLSGAPLYDYDGCEPANRDGCHGMRLFAESRGYRVVENFTQLILGYDGALQGFTFEDFKDEIDAGRPVLIHVEGHTMLGFGYNQTGSTIYIHDTWDYDDYAMTWGGSYSGMLHYGVTVFQVVTVPTVDTNSISNVGTTSATCGGQVLFGGFATVSARGVCWDLFPNPTVADSKTVNGTGTGSFASNLTGLQPATTYYVRAYATNSEGTSYGQSVYFTTNGASPTVVARETWPIDGSEIGYKGEVVAAGAASVTSRGICYSLTPYPTKSDFYIQNGSGLGAFSGTMLDGISPGTRYYVRAFAENAYGLSYSEQKSLTMPTTGDYFVSPDSDCGGNEECRTKIATAYGEIGDGFTIWAKEENLGEALVLNRPIWIEIAGRQTFSSVPPTQNTEIKSLTIRSGRIVASGLSIIGP